LPIDPDLQAARPCAGERDPDRRQHLAIGYWNPGMTEHHDRPDEDRDAGAHAAVQEAQGC